MYFYNLTSRLVSMRTMRSRKSIIRSTGRSPEGDVGVAIDYSTISKENELCAARTVTDASLSVCSEAVK